MSRKLPYKDFTLKAIVNDFGKIENALKKLNAKGVGVDLQKDTYFKINKGRLKWRQGTIENLITHYERVAEDGLEKTIVYRYDLNPSQEQILKLYRDHAVIGIIEKERKIYFVGSVKIHLDKTPENKFFIEIEAIDRGDTTSSDELRLRCMSAKESLGIEDAEIIKTGYLPDEN